jgi:transposase
MLQLAPQSVIFVASICVDFRKGIDGLTAVCKQQLLLDPLGGALFLFYNKGRTAIKILSFDGQGYWLCTKRLSSGRFKAKTSVSSSANSSSDHDSFYKKICYRALHVLIHNGDLASAKIGKDWKSVAS